MSSRTRFWAITGASCLLLLLVAGAAFTSHPERFAAPAPARRTGAAVSVRQGDPNAPAAPGEPLQFVGTPPDGTHTSVRLADVASGTRFAVTFEPYGFGLDSNVVARIDGASTVAGTGASRFADTLAGANLVLRLTPAVAGSVKRGGTYAGTLELTPSGGGTAFTIVAVAPPK